MIILKSKIYVGLGSFRPEMNHLSTLHVIKYIPYMNTTTHENNKNDKEFKMNLEK